MTMSDVTDAESVSRKAFEEFMLGSGPRSSQMEGINSVKKPSTGTISPKKSTQDKKLVNGIKAFQQSLVHDWLDTDDELYQVISSISNLRERCCETNHRLTKHRNNGTLQHDRRNNWSAYGYRAEMTSTTSLLLEEDLEMALSYTLLQHERMMAASRQLLAKLGQAQEALGRRLDELLSCVYDREMMAKACPGVSYGDEDAPSDREILRQVDECQQVYHATARELYRKQVLAIGVLDETTAQDSLLLSRSEFSFSHSADDAIDDHDDRRDELQLQHPVHRARHCKKQWLSHHHKSHLHPYLSLLSRMRRSPGV